MCLSKMKLKKETNGYENEVKFILFLHVLLHKFLD